jgi:hypothetical protein
MTTGHLLIQPKHTAVVAVMSENSVAGSQTAVSVANYGGLKMRMLKHRLHEGLNTIAHLGKLQLKYLDYQDRKLHGWFLAHEGITPDDYQVYIALTGETVNDEFNYVTSTQTEHSGGYYVVHAYD